MDKTARVLNWSCGPTVAVLALMFACCCPAQALDTDNMTGSVSLEADNVSYNDESGEATAKGNAVLNYNGATINAERIDYDAATQKVKASPLPGKAVILNAAGKSMSGDSLEYDLTTGEGVFKGAKSSLAVGEGALYLYGGSVEVTPYDLAVEQGLVKADQAKDGAYVAQWHNVAATTCALDHPHYRLETKRIIFIPGKRVIAKRPRLYLGNTFLFTYPMDYVVNIERKAMQYSMTPYFGHSERKGTGVGFSGAFAWETGSLSLGLSYWSDIDFEWMAEIEQSIGKGFSVIGGVDYSWDKAWDEKKYHPYASLIYEKSGWKAALNWSRNEYIEDQKDSLYEYQGRLTREPEVVVSSPWIDDPIGNSWYKVHVAWGSYKEKTPLFNNDTIMRYGASLQSYAEFPMNSNFEAFWNASYSGWFYDKDGDDQQILEGIFGLRYNIGRVEMASGYERRYVWGESPMLWDSYRDVERIHQKVRFPIGKEIFVAVRGSYDLNESMIDEVNYALQWINDCMKWELSYRDDRTSGGDDRLNLSLYILAFPNTPASFGQGRSRDPFERPNDLPDKR